MISSAVDGVVGEFLSQVASKYNIPQKELSDIWNNVDVSKPVSTPLAISPELSKLSKSELQMQCKARGLKSSGTRQELIDRLTGGATTVAAVSENSKAAKGKTSTVTPQVIKTIQSQIQLVKIEKNSFGNFMHFETQLVFDRVTQQVIGKQNKNGNIDSLTKDDIETCNKFKFKYVMPENLNTGQENSAVVEELDEDPEEEELLEEEEELAEEEEEDQMYYSENDE